VACRPSSLYTALNHQHQILLVKLGAPAYVVKLHRTSHHGGPHLLTAGMLTQVVSCSFTFLAYRQSCTASLSKNLSRPSVTFCCQVSTAFAEYKFFIVSGYEFLHSVQFCNRLACFLTKNVTVMQTN